MGRRRRGARSRTGHRAARRVGNGLAERTSSGRYTGGRNVLDTPAHLLGPEQRAGRPPCGRRCRRLRPSRWPALTVWPKPPSASAPAPTSITWEERAASSPSGPPVVLDVRTRPEPHAGHIPGARSTHRGCEGTCNTSTRTTFRTPQASSSAAPPKGVSRSSILSEAMADRARPSGTERYALPLGARRRCVPLTVTGRCAHCRTPVSRRLDIPPHGPSATIDGVLSRGLTAGLATAAVALTPGGFRIAAGPRSVRARRVESRTGQSSAAVGFCVSDGGSRSEPRMNSAESGLTTTTTLVTLKTEPSV